MRLLLGESLSLLARMLQEADRDMVHVTAVGLGSTDDAEIPRRSS
jgi:predicted nuclease of predicted toxin-antitoxin system